MPSAWTCLAHPETHGSFLQIGLDTLSAIYGGAVQPRDRYACPICIANGEYGALRPADETEAARLSSQLQEA